MATSLKPPMSARGWVSDAFFSEVLDELTEDVRPELIWPLSVQTFTGMAREARVAAVLSGYELQLRRAQWQVDGRGCRPEVVQLVADCLGLPVAGKDEPTGARTRGVSWSEHLRAALLSLRYGHYGFHLHAELVNGVARLVGLYDRPPWTISQIHADPKTGAFKGITQDYTVRADGGPQIKADNLAWYVHDRIGAAWFGTSILKPAWPAYTVKREMLRVHGTANRRWSAGVPVMEALPGTSPTPEQMSEAAQLAMAARAGEQAGASTPPGFTMKILGITGQIPDTLAFMEFLNREIAGAVLMPHLDLGTGTSGSRATATAFLDSWTLALEAIGEEIADAATRQIAARIVAWNWGDSEAVPRVAVSGVGSRREVTAESLQLLLTSGALSADPALEDWVRREYRLPERTVISRSRLIPASPPKATPAPTPATAKRARSSKPRREPASQLALPILAAAPADVAAQVDLSTLRADYEAALARISDEYEDVSESMVAEIVLLVSLALRRGDLADTIAVDGLMPTSATVSAVGELLAAEMAAVAAKGTDAARREVADQGVTVEAVPPDADAFRSRADATATVIASGYASGAARTAMTLAGPDVDEAVVASEVRAHLDGLTATAVDGGRGWVITNMASALTAAQAEGRRALFDALIAAGHKPVFVANEDHDDGSRCAPCRDVHGTVFTTITAAYAAYPAGQYRACEGRDRCRGHLIAVLPDAEV